jgi:hypothetical protein
MNKKGRLIGFALALLVAVSIKSFSASCDKEGIAAQPYSDST